jgi:hypothetical protein
MRVALALLLGGLLAGCGGSADAGGPVVHRIDDAVAALAVEIGIDDPSLFEIAVDLTGITMVLAETEIDADTGETTGTFATPYRWEGGSIARAGETSPADGAVFAASAVDVDPDRIFERIRAELDSPDIVDLVIQGGPDGATVIDATVVNERGGTLLVLLGADGAILGVQAA